MRNTEIVYQFIEDNQPISRANVIHKLVQFSNKTIYKHIKILIDDSRVFFDKNGNLITNKEQANPLTNKNLTWVIHPLLTQFKDVTPITHAYASKNPELKPLLDNLLKEHGQQMATLLIDLIVLSNYNEYGFALSHNYTDLNNDQIPLEQYVNNLSDKLSSLK